MQETHHRVKKTCRSFPPMIEMQALEHKHRTPFPCESSTG